MEINSSRKAYEVLRKLFQNDVEEFWILALDSQLRIIQQSLLFKGTVDSCLIHPRDIIRFVCSANASSYIVAHNHPSGDPRPSREDKTVTRNLFQISRMIQVNIQDHIICGDSSYYSFADTGFFLKLRENKTLNEFLRLKS